MWCRHSPQWPNISPRSGKHSRVAWTKIQPHWNAQIQNKGRHRSQNSPRWLNMSPIWCFFLGIYGIFFKPVAWTKIQRRWNAQIQDKGRHIPQNSPRWPSMSPIWCRHSPQWPNISPRSGKHSLTAACPKKETKTKKIAAKTISNEVHKSYFFLVFWVFFANALHGRKVNDAEMPKSKTTATDPIK